MELTRELLGCSELPVHAPETDLARGLLHDLGHELATLVFLVDAVRSDPGLSGATKKRVELLGRQISRLVDLARPAAAAEPAIAHRPVSVRELLAELVSLTAHSTGTSIALTPGLELILHTDADALRRMVNNLVDNAVRAAGPMGRVDITVDVDGQHADGQPYIEISDDGPGFGNGDHGWASRGLGIVWHLAGECGADVRITSRKPHGTTVRLSFAQQAVLQLPAQRATSLASRWRRIGRPR
ncbi:MAG: sensor histidine kinase [Sciscionella sp.]|nr:sensor histidine kinase [Sciscionella sp.]